MIISKVKRQIEKITPSGKNSTEISIPTHPYFYRSSHIYIYFSGIMFPVKCKEILPLDHLVINSIAVRGALGPLTVWITKSEQLGGEIVMSKKHWSKIYQKEHQPSFVGYKELDLSANPIILKPGQVKGIYIHSTRRGDEAIVYDNKAKQKTVDDAFITILPGRAHVSEKPFGAIPIWGWGSACE